MVEFIANIPKVSILTGFEVLLGTNDVVVIIGACCFVNYQEFATVRNNKATIFISFLVSATNDTLLDGQFYFSKHQ